MAQPYQNTAGIDAEIAQNVVVVTQAPAAAPYGAPMYYMTGEPGNVSVIDTEITVGPQPLMLQCPFCHETVVTVIEHKNTGKTHCLACCICCLG